MAHAGEIDKPEYISRRRIRPVAMLAATFACALVVALTGCRPDPVGRVELPPTPQLFGSMPWGLIVPVYAKGLAEPKPDAGVARLLRGGDVVEIIERGRVQERQYGVSDYWYRVRAGGQEFWLFGSQLSFYGLEMQARTASRIIAAKLFKD